MVKGLGFTQIFRNKAILINLIFILIPVFLYTNVEAIYGATAGQAEQILLIYLVMYAFVLASLKGGLPQGKNLGDGFSFAIMFAGTALVMLFLPVLTAFAGSIEVIKLALGYGLLHGVVKTYIEEVIFRYGIGDKLLGGTPAAGIIQAILFGVFHFAVSGGNIFTMVWLSGMGMIWWFIYKRWGLLGSSGSHLAYNLAAFGALGMII